MKHLNNYNLFLYESNIEMVEVFNDADILESIVTDTNDLLKSINAEEVDIFQTFNINPDNFDRDVSLEDIFEDEDFNKNINKKNFKKNNIEYSEESETFLEETIIIKFFTIYKKDSSELEKPEYIVFQSKNKKSGNWENIKCYKVNEDMRKFYDKLTNKTIEIKKGEKKYVYVTSNSGNDWILQKHKDEQETDNFKEYMTNDTIKAVLEDDDVSITILA
jgi:hypothetical protein